MSTINVSEFVAAHGTNVFPKHLRLKNASDYRRVYEAGEKRISPCFVVFALRNGFELSRFGLTTPRKLGKAHDRNRIKRRIREILRTSNTRIPPGFDFVVNPKRSALADSDFEELRRQLVALLGAQE